MTQQDQGDFRYHEFQAVAKLREATGDLRLIGITMVAIGSLMGLPFLTRGVWTAQARMLASCDMLAILFPGAWYVVASAMLAKKQFGLIRVSQRIVITQVTIAASAALFAIITDTGLEMPLLAPAVLMVFFVPALLVTLSHVRRVEKAMHLLSADGHAFEAILPAIPIETPHSIQQQGITFNTQNPENNTSTRSPE